VPRDDARVARRLVEDLVVPEADDPRVEELRRLHGDRGVPEDVVEVLVDEPRAEEVEDVPVGRAAVVLVGGLYNMPPP